MISYEVNFSKEAFSQSLIEHLCGEISNIKGGQSATQSEQVGSDCVLMFFAKVTEDVGEAIANAVKTTDRSQSIFHHINVNFVSNDEIRKLNKQFRGKDSVTDVLSFNMDEEDLLGEVYIAPQFVASVVGDGSLPQELIRLIVHGTLHLLGYDHEESFKGYDGAADVEEMFKLQEEVVERVAF